MVKKTNRKWRMCVDFTDLNKACPKDSYPLLRVDILVDFIAQHQLLSFMDVFSGYNQIRMDEADQEKTSFVTSQGLFCYKVMPFNLKSASATYQRLMNKMFAKPNRKEYSGLRQQHVSKEPKRGRPFEGSRGNIRHPSLL